jgi:hypothetical protein
MHQLSRNPAHLHREDLLAMIAAAWIPTTFEKCALFVSTVQRLAIFPSVPDQ